MDIPVPSLTDLKMMAAMRIASDGRTLARVTAELPRAQVNGEYLVGFAYSLGPLERDRAAREIDHDRRETTAVVRIPHSHEHRGKLITYELEAHEGHTLVNFTLAIHQRDVEAAGSEN